MKNEIEELQEKLVKILKENGIKSSEILEVFHNVRRYDFIKDYITSEKELEYAYFNPFPIGFDQTISQPLVCATMLEALQIKKTDIVYEIGTGSGYLTAILANLAKEVYTAEINNTLLSAAKKRLDALGYKNIKYYSGNGLLGVENILFDKIIISAALTATPATLINSLKVGGILVAPFTTDKDSIYQKLVKITKTEDKFKEEFICYCSFVPIQSDIQN